MSGSGIRSPAAAAALSVLLAACGGGGSSSSNAPLPAPPSMSLNANTLSGSADVSQGAPAPAVVQVSIANAPPSPLAYRLTSSGAAIASASFAWQTSATGQLTVAVAAPSTLGAGTYDGTVQLSVCTDSACNQPIAGSPAMVSVNYTVTDAAHGPPPSFNLVPSDGVSFQSMTAVTAAQTQQFTLDLENVPPAGLYVQLQQPSGGFITNVSYTQSGLSNGGLDVNFTMSFVSPASLGSGFFKSSVTFMICLDQACSQQIAGSPVTQPVSYTVVLTPGHEYTQQSVSSGGITDVTYDPVGKQLYVSSLNGYPNSFSGAVTQVDPATGAPGTQAVLADDLTTLAASGDGQYLYVASKGGPVVHRLLLPALTADLDIPLGTDPVNGPNVAHQIAVAPGAAHTVAVTLGHPNGYLTSGTKLFDDAVARTNYLAPVGDNANPDSIAWSDSAALLYAFRYSYQLPFVHEIDSVTADSSGLSVAGATVVDSEPVESIKYQQGHTYDQIGYVRDASSGSVVGQFVLPLDPGHPEVQIEAMVPDSAHGRAFLLIHGEDSHRWLYTYSLSSYALLSIIDLGYDSFDPTMASHMIVWGTNGVAFNRDGATILAGTFVAAPEQGTGGATARIRELGHLHLSPAPPRH